MGEHWRVEHAYPCGIEGWLVIVLNRHAEALHELTAEEFLELTPLMERAIIALRSHLHCEKEYVACFAEAEHFNHIHVHVIAKPIGLPQELRGTAIFNMLKVTEDEAVPPDRIAALCVQLQPYFR
jgi:diadenosine tetraphosphate (Ap4A) HIT family hydrolase